MVYWMCTTSCDTFVSKARCQDIMQMNRLVRTVLTLPFAVALAVVLGLAGGAALLYAVLDEPEGERFQVCVDQAGHMRKIGPEITGRFGTECRENEVLIELPSSQWVAVLEGDVTGLQGDVTGLQGDVTGLQGTVSGLQGDVTGLQGDVTGLQGTVSGLQGDVTGLQGDVTGLQGDVTGLRGDVTGLQGDVTGLGTRLSDLENRVADLEWCQGTVLCLRLDMGTGTVAKDGSGFGNHCTINGASWVAGKVKNALSFDGVDDYVDCGNSKSLYPEKFTVQLWAKSATLTWNDNGWMASMRDKSGFVVHPVKDGKSVRFYIIDDTGSYYIIGTVTPSDITLWHHYAATWDGSDAKIYLDGTLRRTTALTLSRLVAGTNTLSIGSDGGMGRFGNGLVDEVRIYNRALSADEIVALYAQGQ